MEDLADVLAGDSTQLPPIEGLGPLRLVPVGMVGLLPVGAALSGHNGSVRAVSVAGTGLLHRQAHAHSGLPRSGEAARIAALTSPSPCDWDGRRWPPLPAGVEEGLVLEQDYDADHWTGYRATAAALVAAFADESIDVVHIAAHGHISSDEGGVVRILLANGADGQAATVTEHDLPQSLGGKSLFLACCWLGRNSTRLPDEAAGFPTWLIQSGAARVVAPLWPVDDKSTLRFVTAFYAHWLWERQPAALALAQTRADMHDWADMAADADPDLATVLRATADAFVITGA
jgi:CHAT domain-containing protein